jgi:hypothetical protein
VSPEKARILLASFSSRQRRAKQKIREGIALPISVSCPQNSIEKFNVETEDRALGAAKIRREMQRNASTPLAPQRNARPLDKDL